jgi:hypothetical protein
LGQKSITKSNISPLKQGCEYWKIISPLGEEYQPTFLCGGGRYMKQGREKRGKCEEKRRKDKR